MKPPKRILALMSAGTILLGGANVASAASFAPAAAGHIAMPLAAPIALQQGAALATTHSAPAPNLPRHPDPCPPCGRG